MNEYPWLRSGTGESPDDGGCIMQVIDWLDRAGWSDHPECVHPVFRSLGIWINDQTADADRQRLLDLTPRLMGTNTGDDILTTRLLLWLARQVLPIYESYAPTDDRVRRSIEATQAWADCPCGEHARVRAAWAAGAAGAARAAWAAGAAWAARAAWAAGAAWAARAARAAGAEPLALLVGCLDEYDRLTGRTEVPEIDFAPVCAVMAS